MSDPIVEAVAEALHETAREHRPSTGMQVASGATCTCGYWTGSERQGPIPSGWHLLMPHLLREAAEVAVTTVRSYEVRDPMRDCEDVALARRAVLMSQQEETA